MSFVDEEVGWAVAAICPVGSCAWWEQVYMLVWTTEGGRTWQLLESRLIP